MKICQYEGCSLEIESVRKRCPKHAHVVKLEQMQNWHVRNPKGRCERPEGRRRRGRARFFRPPVPEKKEYNSSDLMHLSVEKLPAVVSNIASGYYLFKP